MRSAAFEFLNLGLIRKQKKVLHVKRAKNPVLYPVFSKPKITFLGVEERHFCKDKI